MFSFQQIALVTSQTKTCEVSWNKKGHVNATRSSYIVQDEIQKTKREQARSRYSSPSRKQELHREVMHVEQVTH